MTPVLKQYSINQETEAIVSLTNDLKKILVWASDWRLEYNTAKTVLMKFSHTTSIPISLQFGGSVLQSVDSHCHLGVVLSSNLKWSAHVDQVVSKTSKKLGLLKHQSQWLSFDQRCIIYLCVIKPAIEYASILYGGGSLLDNLRLDHLQRRAALACTGAMYRMKHNALMEILRWESLQSRRSLAALCLFYQVL